MYAKKIYVFVALLQQMRKGTERDNFTKKEQKCKKERERGRERTGGCRGRERRMSTIPNYFANIKKKIMKKNLCTATNFSNSMHFIRFVYCFFLSNLFFSLPFLPPMPLSPLFPIFLPSYFSALSFSSFISSIRLLFLPAQFFSSATAATESDYKLPLLLCLHITFFPYHSMRKYAFYAFALGFFFFTTPHRWWSFDAFVWRNL